MNKAANAAMSAIISVSIVGCSSTPQIVVDPQSIKDVVKYDRDLAECKSLSEGYDSSGAKMGNALIGAGLAVGATMAVAATGGLILLPVGAAIAGGLGGAAGASLTGGKESSARERIWADCMTQRGYKAYSSK